MLIMLSFLQGAALLVWEGRVRLVMLRQVWATLFHCQSQGQCHCSRASRQGDGSPLGNEQEAERWRRGGVMGGE